MQVDVFVKSGHGEKELLGIIDKIRTHFKAEKSLTQGSDTVNIRPMTPVSQPRRDEAWWTCFIEIHFFCYS